nr:conserved hypothetical protein [blood disease bacterium R229]
MIEVTADASCSNGAQRVTFTTGYRSIDMESADRFRRRIMIHHHTDRTFRGLPLTAEQEAEVRHYLNRKARLGKPWDTPELREMLADMLLPPSAGDDSLSDSPLDTLAAAERATAFVDEAMEPIEAHEEWIAAMETEGMKGHTS